MTGAIRDSDFVILSRCTASGAATSHYTFADVDLLGDGATGAHGGSGLSALGGNLRVGELRPNGGNVRHVLKVEMWKAENYFTCASARYSAKRGMPCSDPKHS